VIRDVVTKPFTLQQIRDAVSEAMTDGRAGGAETPATRQDAEGESESGPATEKAA
jgi:hypothetical protein